MYEPKDSSYASPPNRSAGFLEVETGTLAGRRVLLPESPAFLLLGREAGCDLTFDHAQEGMVGRRHARIEVRPDGTYLVDLNSVNGTFRTSGPVEGEVRLSAGERFQLGGEGGPWLRVHLEEAAARGPAPPRSLFVDQGTTAPASPLLAARAAADAPTAPFTGPAVSLAQPSAAVAAVLEPASPRTSGREPLKETAATGSGWHPAVSQAPAYSHAPMPLQQPSVGSAPRAAPTRAREAPAVRSATNGLIHHPLLRQALILALLFFGACALGAALGLRDVWFTPGSGAASPERGGAE